MPSIVIGLRCSLRRMCDVILDCGCTRSIYRNPPRPVSSLQVQFSAIVCEIVRNPFDSGRATKKEPPVVPVGLVQLVKFEEVTVSVSGRKDEEENIQGESDSLVTYENEDEIIWISDRREAEFAADSETAFSLKNADERLTLFTAHPLRIAEVIVEESEIGIIEAEKCMPVTMIDSAVRTPEVIEISESGETAASVAENETELSVNDTLD